LVFITQIHITASYFTLFIVTSIHCVIFTHISGVEMMTALCILLTGYCVPLQFISECVNTFFNKNPQL